MHENVTTGDYLFARVRLLNTLKNILDCFVFGVISQVSQSVVFSTLYLTQDNNFKHILYWHKKGLIRVQLKVVKFVIIGFKTQILKGNNLPASEASKEVANLTERKNPHTPYAFDFEALQCQIEPVILD